MEVGLVAKVTPELDEKKAQKEAGRLSSMIEESVQDIDVGLNLDEAVANAGEMKSQVEEMETSFEWVNPGDLKSRGGGGGGDEGGLGESLQSGMETFKSAWNRPMDTLQSSIEEFATSKDSLIGKMSDQFDELASDTRGGGSMAGMMDAVGGGGADGGGGQATDMDVAGAMENIPTGGGGKLSGGGGGGGGGGNDGMKKKMGGLSKKMGTLSKGLMAGGAAVAIAGLGLLALTKIWSGIEKLAEHSPLLGTVVDMIGMALSLFFRPFGNIIGQWLMPIAKSMVQLAAEFNKVFEEQGIWAAMAFLAAAIVKGLVDAVLSVDVVSSIEWIVFGGDGDFGFADVIRLALLAAFSKAALGRILAASLPKITAERILGWFLPKTVVNAITKQIGSKFMQMGLTEIIKKALPNLGVTSFLKGIFPSIGIKSMLGRIAPSVGVKSLLGRIAPSIGVKAFLSKIGLSSIGRIFGARLAGLIGGRLIGLLGGPIGAAIMAIDLLVMAITWAIPGVEMFSPLNWAIQMLWKGTKVFVDWLMAIPGMLGDISISGMASGTMDVLESGIMGIWNGIKTLVKLLAMPFYGLYGLLQTGFGMLVALGISTIEFFDWLWGALETFIGKFSGVFDWFSDPNLPGLSDLNLPDFSMPDLSMPEFSLPSMDDLSGLLPDISVSDITGIFPDFSWPSLPDFSWPDLGINWGSYVPSVGIGDLFQWVNSPGASLSDLFQFIGIGLSSFISAIFPSVGTGDIMSVFPDFSWPSLPSFSWPSIPSFPGWSGVKSSLSGLSSDISSGASSVSSSIKGFAGDIKSGASSIAGNIGSFAGKIKSGAMNVAGKVKGFATDMATRGAKAAKRVNELGSKVRSGAVKVGKRVGGLASSVLSGKTSVSNALGKLKGDLTSGASQLKTSLSSAAGNISSAATSALSDISSKVTDGLGDLGSKIDSGLSDIDSAVSSGISSVQGAADTAVSGGQSAASSAWESTGGRLFASGGVVTSQTNAVIGEGSESEVVLPESKLSTLVSNASMLPAGAGSQMGGISSTLSNLGVSVPHLADGGVVQGDTLARIGEGGESEAVAPLSKLQSMIDMPEGEGVGRGSSRGKSIDVSVNAQQGNRENIAAQIEAALGTKLDSIESALNEVIRELSKGDFVGDVEVTVDGKTVAEAEAEANSTYRDKQEVNK